MYHSVTFGEKNTWEDWGLISKERPFVAPPSAKRNTVDIPGASTKLDFSQGLTGYPVFNNRTGTLNFTIVDQYLSDQETIWAHKYSEIMDYISGRHLKMVLEDDPEYFFEGTFDVASYKPGQSSSDSFATIGINYDVNPYKWSNIDSLDPNWLWDPFSFVDGVKDLPVTTTEATMELPKELIGTAPFCPEFIITANAGIDVSIHIINEELGIDKTKVVRYGTHRFYDCIFYADAVTDSKTILKYKTLSGTATMSLKYRRGGL